MARCLCTGVNRRGQLKAELQLAADMICWQPATQRITHYPIPEDKRQRQTEKQRKECIKYKCRERQEENRKIENAEVCYDISFDKQEPALKEMHR